MNNALKNILFLAGGTAIGVIAGLLTAPKSGKESREDILKKIDKLKSQIQDLSGEARSQVDEKITELKESLKVMESQFSN